MFLTPLKMLPSPEKKSADAHERTLTTKSERVDRVDQNLIKIVWRHSRTTNKQRNKDSFTQVRR